VNHSTVYRYIYKEIIPPECVTRDPASGVYLIRNDSSLIEQLRKRVVEHKEKNGLLNRTASA
jgi:hypothetical protein